MEDGAHIKMRTRTLAVPPMAALRPSACAAPSNTPGEGRGRDVPMVAQREKRNIEHDLQQIRQWKECTKALNDIISEGQVDQANRHPPYQLARASTAAPQPPSERTTARGVNRLRPILKKATIGEFAKRSGNKFTWRLPSEGQATCTQGTHTCG